MSELEVRGEEQEREIERLQAENERLRQVIQRVLDDEESRPGGWGPDITATMWLRDALAGSVAPGQEGLF